MRRIRLETHIEGAPEDLEVLLGAVGPERDEELPGVDVQLAPESARRLRFVVEGDRVPPVRAAVNAYLGWLGTVEEVLDVATHPPEEPTHGR